MGTLFLQNWADRKIVSFGSFSKTTGFQLNFLTLIQSPNIYIYIYIYFTENQQNKKQIGCGLEAKFGPNYVQCCEKSKETGNIIRCFHVLSGNYILKQ